MTHPPIQVGSLVVAKRSSGVCNAGERGVCYELYQLGGRHGYGILFQSGRYDGFSPEDVAMFLDVADRVCPEVADYRFASVLQLARDFEQGRFAAAFPPPKTYTGYRQPGDQGTATQALVIVHQEGQPHRPLDPRFDLRRHSDGLNWGFGGSGPAARRRSRPQPAPAAQIQAGRRPGKGRLVTDRGAAAAGHLRG
jgi:hypothetical protein